MSKRTCQTEGCDNPHHAKGMCSRHYNRWAYRRRRDPERWAAFRSELEAAQEARAHAVLSADKTCSKCRTRQSKTEFTKASRSADGLHSWCKACLRDLAKRRYDPERARRKHAEKKEDPLYRAMRKAAYDRWRSEHPDRARAATRAWRAANPERPRESVRRYFARLADSTVGEVDYTEVLQRDGMWCYLCRADISTLDDLHFDHVLPLARGGAHSMENIRPAHARCNLSKGHRLLSELDWYRPE